MSPFVVLSTSASAACHSRTANGEKDVWRGSVIDYCIELARTGVPESFYPYMDMSSAPDNWYDGLQNIVDRILITGGGDEVLKDEIHSLSEKISAYHSNTKLVIQVGGIHNDPYFDFFAKEKVQSKLTPILIDWLMEGFSSW